MVGEDSVQCPLREPTRADYYYGPSHYLERPTFEEPAPKHQRLSYSPVQATEQIFPIITSPKVPLPPKTQQQQPITPTHVNVITPPIQQQHQPIQAIQSPIKPIESPTKQPQPQVHLPSSSSFLSSFSSSAFSSFSSSAFSSFSSASMSSSPSTSVSSSSSSNSRALPLSPVESPVQLPIPSSSLPPPAHFSSPYSASFVLPSIPASHSSFPSFSTSSSFSSSSFSSPLPARAESRRKSEQESLEGLVGLAGLAGLADIASQDIQLKIERDADTEETERGGGMHAAKEELNQLMERVCEQTGQSTSIIQDIKATALLNGMAVQVWENTKVEQVIVKANRCIDSALDRARRRESEIQNLFSTIRKATKAPPPPPPPVTTRQTRRSRKIK